MSYNFEPIHAKTEKHCVKCELNHEVTIRIRNYSKEDFAEHADTEVEDQAIKDGWKGGYCPQCAEEHKTELLADSKADDEIEL